MYTFTNKFCSVLLGIYVYSLVISFKQVMEIICSQHDDCMHDYQLLFFVIHTTVQFVIHQLVSPNASYKSFS